MNFDRLLKLLKLANHNPNDAEANSAARAASKMLGEDNYKWIEGAKKNGNRPLGEPTIREYFDPSTDETIIRISRINEASNPKIKQLITELKKEIEKPKAQPKTQYDWQEYGSWKDGYWEADWFGKYREREQQRERDYQYAKAYQYYERKRPYSNAQREPEYWSWTTEKEDKRKYTKTYKQVCRDCTVCKITRLTADESNPYICYQCKTKT